MEEREYNDPVSIQDINPYNALLIHMPDLAIISFTIITALAFVISGAFGWLLMYGAVFVAGFHYIWFVGKRKVPKGDPEWRHITNIGIVITINACIYLLAATGTVVFFV